MLPTAYMASNTKPSTKPPCKFYPQDHQWWQEQEHLSRGHALLLEPAQLPGKYQHQQVCK